MPVNNIIVGQRLSQEKHDLAKQLRREMTGPERLVWERVRANRVCGLRFRRQQVIDGYIADFYCHSKSLVVEIDGPIHEAQREYDSHRDRVFRERGFVVLRFRNVEVLRDLDSVIQRIVMHCAKSHPLASCEDLSPLAPLSEAERGEQE